MVKEYDNVNQIVSNLTIEQKRQIAKSNGWQSLWSEDNWVRTSWLNDRKINIDWAGESLDHVIKGILNGNSNSSYRRNTPIC